LYSGIQERKPYISDHIIRLVCAVPPEAFMKKRTLINTLAGNTSILEHKNICAYLLAMGDMVPFVTLLSRTHSKIRIYALKIIGGLLEHIEKVKLSEIDYFFPVVKQKFSCFSVTELTYNAFKEILMGRYIEVIAF